MNTLFVLAALTSAIPGWMAPDYHDLPPDLAKAALAYDEAQLRNDGPELNRLLADDYKLVSRAGTVLNKTQFVAHSTDPNGKLLPFTIEQPLHTVWADGAVLGGKVNYRTVDHGKESAQLLLFADIWAKRGGIWQVVYTQVSAAKAP
jgi:hypothetical protein